MSRAFALKAPPASFRPYATLICDPLIKLGNSTTRHARSTRDQAEAIVPCRSRTNQPFGELVTPLRYAINLKVATPALINLYRLNRIGLVADQLIIEPSKR